MLESLSKFENVCLLQKGKEAETHGEKSDTQLFICGEYSCRENTTKRPPLPAPPPVLLPIYLRSEMLHEMVNSKGVINLKRVNLFF